MSHEFQDNNDILWSSIFNNNSNISYNLAGGTIINNNSNNSYIVSRDSKSDIATIESALGKHHVPGAAFEAHSREHGCMPGTRVQLLEAVFGLLKTCTGPHMVWIAGMAGTGKTSIALTLCRMLWHDTSVYLGGTFFCSRSAVSIERTDVQRIIPTLATLLARQFPAFASSLARQFTDTPDVAHWSVRDQVDRLVVQPLEELATYTGQIVFVIDALDECNNSSQLGELISAIADFRSTLPIKFLLTSRPEMYIRRTPINDPILSSILRLHTVDPDQVTADIRLYISTMFARVSGTITWYSVQDIEALVTLSGGLFIFASTVLQYILDKDNNHGRRERLRKATTTVAHSVAATATLDQIYELVITEASRSDRVDADELESMRQILACILTARASLSVHALADLVKVSPASLRCSLERLHSLVHLPNEDTEPDVRTLHASFGDYMLSRAASHIRLAPSLGHDLLADGCLRRMGWPDLCFNISCSYSSFEPYDEFEPESISLSLIYACLHWAHHIDAASTRSAFDEMVGGIFRRKFLFWLEVLSITEKMTVASGLLRIASSSVKLQEVARFLRDANSFVASSYAAITLSAPHIYLSAVPFASKDSLVYQDFAPLCTGVVSVETFGTDHHASRLDMTLIGHEYRVNSVAYSPSGNLLASGSKDVRIWDTRTGEEVISPIRSRDGEIYSLVFAPDDQRVASGSQNGVVSVWNVATGQLDLRRPLAHSKTVNVMAFSPDGKLIASDSTGTIGLWDLETGQTVSAQSDSRPESWPPVSLSFSPDGKILTLRTCNGEQLWHTCAPGCALQLLPCRDKCPLFHSCSPRSFKFSLAWGERCILLSDTRTGRVASLPFPEDDVTSVQLSADETCIVVSQDSNAGLLLWDLRCIDADPPLTILGENMGIVRDISFSSDGRYLVSGSSDGTIRIWDASPGHDAVQHVQESGVTAVAVSPDNTFITCSRGDGSVQVYDVENCGVKLRLLIDRETSWPECVAISPDGQKIASGSNDGTIRMWCVHTGAPIGEPLTNHQNSVIVVTFSQDAQWLASGSADKTVLIWDVASGNSMVSVRMLCEDTVEAVAFLPSGQVLAAGDSKGNIYFWNLVDGQLVHQLQLESSSALAFSPSASRLLASGWGNNNSIYIFDVNTGEELNSWKAETEINSAAWSPCERYIVLASYDSEGQTVRLWDHEHKAVTGLHGHNSDYVESVAFAPDGRFIASGAIDGVIRVWDAEGTRSPTSLTEQKPAARLANAELGKEWLLGPSGELLLWVPAYYHGYLHFPPYAMVLGQRRVVVTVGDPEFHWDDEWHACWRGVALVDE